MHTEYAVALLPRPRTDPAFRADVLAGLAGAPRAIPSRWLYDRRGSELFEAITRQPEHCPTRTERTILDEAAPAIQAAFNRNLLHRSNTEPEGTTPAGGFRHPARWNAAESRIETYLEDIRHLAFSVAGHAFSMAAGATSHTEISVKYRPEDARGPPRAAGWFAAMERTDRRDHFAVILARRPPAGAHWELASPDTVDASRRGVLS